MFHPEPKFCYVCGVSDRLRGGREIENDAVGLRNRACAIRREYMKKIYFDNRSIIICGLGEAALADPNAIEFHIKNVNDLDGLVGMFENRGSVDKIYVPTSDEDSCYAEICANFKNVNAAGGLVANRRGDYLLIRRNDLWDLPKGHQEADEDIKITAMREVQEETGVEELELGELICVTDHCYLRNDIWHLKHTYWFQMTYTNMLDLTPQREEDISRAAWVAKSSLPAYLKNTYPSIREVFLNAKV